MSSPTETFNRLQAEYHHAWLRYHPENSVDVGLHDHAHLLRARELFFLDRIVDARREWYQAMRYLDQEQIKIAATLASRWKWHDSAIRTVARTPHRSDYSLRFPMPYKQQVMELARSKELDPALIYGVMRRESLFDPLARSRVGALGLMQLMPSTARLVARSLGMKKPRQADILRVENNLSFGTERWGYYETLGGGAGATPTGPGASAVQTHMTNTRITDPEVLESRFPVNVVSFAIRRGSIASRQIHSLLKARTHFGARGIRPE